MSVYYNEYDLYAATWLRNLITAGHIADGVVDTRSIEDVRPSDLTGFTQCHFFAGIGVWSLALRRAGWSDDRPVWTGSCPCQPFSAAGKGIGFADERHLWPAFHHLIKECKPECVVGEQVASKDADAWIDLVHTDMEAMGYSFGAVPFPSAGIGAPHIRDRLYWMANSDDKGPQGRRILSKRSAELIVGASGMANGLGDAASKRRNRRPTNTKESTGRNGAQNTGSTGRMGDTQCVRGYDGRRLHRGRDEESGGIEEAVGGELWNEIEGASTANQPGPTNGFWRDADWLGCTDGKWRPVEPNTSPLAHGAAKRVGRLRAYGNAINAEAARCFIEAVMECQP